MADRPHSGNGSDVDNSPPARRYHKASSSLTAQHRLRQIDVNDCQQLITRLPKSVEPTVVCEPVAHTLSDAFNLINLAVTKLSPGPLTLSCSATIMQLWLIPRMNSFRRQYPDVKIQLNVNYGAINFARDQVSIAIRSTMYTPPLDVILKDLLHEKIGPVCHPEYLARVQPKLEKPDDLEHARILGTATRPQAWSEWLTACGSAGPEPSIDEEYEHFYLMLQAASYGLGIAIAPQYLVQREIELGQLVAPFGFVDGPHRLQLWIAPHARMQHDVRVLARWIETNMRQG